MRLIVMSALLIATASLSAHDAPAAAQTASEEATTKKEKLICRRVVAGYGRIAKRMCKTPKQWAADAREDDDKKIDTIGRANHQFLPSTKTGPGG